jgi:hypothetical protein
MSYLENKAADLANVEVRPKVSQGPTVMPGSIMDRSAQPQIYKTKQANETLPMSVTKSVGKTFSAIKKSKL